MWLRKVRFSKNLLLSLILLIAIVCLIKFKTIYSQIDQGSWWKQSLMQKILILDFCPTLSRYPFVFNSCGQTESMIEDIIVKVLNNTNNTHHPSPLSTSNRPSQQVSPTNSSENNDIQSEPAHTLWIDLPNIFPWRRCVQEYNNLLTVLDCDKVIFIVKQTKTFSKYFQNIIKSQLFYIVPINSSEIKTGNVLSIYGNNVTKFDCRTKV